MISFSSAASLFKSPLKPSNDVPQGCKETSACSLIHGRTAAVTPESSDRLPPAQAKPFQPARSAQHFVGRQESVQQQVLVSLAGMNQSAQSILFCVRGCQRGWCVLGV